MEQKQEFKYTEEVHFSDLFEKIFVLTSIHHIT